MLKSYFDRSGQENDSFLSLSGIAANDSTWAEIETNWSSILTTCDPKAAYMHMVEAVPLRDEFSREKGWDDTKVANLISALLVYLSRIDKTRYCQFVTTVDMNAYRKLVAEGYRLDSPVDLCNKSCADRVMYWYLREYKGGLDLAAHYYFDQGEPFEPAFKARWENERRIDRETGGYSVWSHIECVTTAQMRITPGLQIADMLAWGNNRQVSAGDFQRYGHVAAVMKWLAPSKPTYWSETGLRFLALGKRP